MAGQGWLSKDQFVAMQEDLLEGFKAEDFQRKLHAGWHAASEHVERMKFKNSVCLEVQGPVIARYGFEASRKGVSQTLKNFFQRLRHEPEILRLNEVLSWLVDPDLQAMEPEGPGGSLSHRVSPKGALSSFGKEVAASASGGRCRESAYVGIWLFGELPTERLSICHSDQGWLRVETTTETGYPMHGFFLDAHEALAELKLVDTGQPVTLLRLRPVGPEHMIVNYCLSVNMEEWTEDRIAVKERSCKVRVTCLEDAGAVNGVERVQGALAGAHQALYKPIYPQLEQEQWFRVLGCDSVQESLESGVLILHAEMPDGQVSGYISCTCHYDASHAAGGEEDGPYAKVNHVAVLPQQRGCGIGRMLFEELVLHLSIASPSVASDLRLRVVERNTFAIEWYERLGFSETKRLSTAIGSSPVVFVEMQRKSEPVDGVG